MNSTPMLLQRRSKNIHKLIQYSRWPLGCLVFFVWGCGHSVPDTRNENAADTVRYLKALDSASGLLKTGDLVFRRGNDPASQTFANMNREDRRFSHVGVVRVENNKPFIVHAIGGSFNPDQKIKKESLDIFAAPSQNLRFAVFRAPALPEELVARMLDSLYHAGVPFDLTFDLKTDDRLYCSEMVYKLLKICNPSLELKTSVVNKHAYVSTETFTRCSGIKEIMCIDLK